MIDRYTKVLLTIIAVCLVAIVVRDIPFVNQAAAQSGGPVHVVVDSVMSYAFQFAGPLHVDCDSGCR